MTRADRSPQLLDQIIERSPIGIAVVDFEGRYCNVNAAYCRLYGYSAEALLAGSFVMVFPPAQRETVLARHQHFLTQGGELRGERDVVRSDGAALSVTTESVRVPGPDGRGRRLVYVVDLTEPKAMEQALRSSQQFLQAVLDGLSAHVCVLDERGSIAAVNRAWRDFAAGGAFASVGEGDNYLQACRSATGNQVPPLPHDEHFERQLGEVIAGRRDGFEFEYSCHAGVGERWFVARASRIAYDDETRIVVAHDNVTELKRAQDTVRRSEALLRDLAASIPGGMFRFVVDASGHGRFSYVSPGFEDLLEIDAARVCADARVAHECILSEDQPAYCALVRAAMAHESAWGHEFRIRTASGAVKWVHAGAKPKADGSGGVAWTGVLADISERKRVEAVLKDSEQTYLTLFETVPQGMVYHDARGRVTSANPAAQRILGLTLAQLQQRSASEPGWQARHEDGSAFSPEQFPAMRALATGQPVKGVVMGIMVPDRGLSWILMTAIPVLKGGRVDAVYTSFEDITPQVALRQELREQAATDFLTGAANRRSFMTRLTQELERVRRHPQLPCSLVSIDIDHFKVINDTWGHALGDAVLKYLTELMRQSTRQIDVVGRVGGEEFALLLPDTGVGEALGLAERLRARVARSPAEVGGRSISFTISIGVTAVLPGDPDIEAVLMRADRALYDAKSRGRNNVRLAPPMA